MSLQVWLPLNGNLNNQGLLAWQPTLDSGTTATYVSGKIGQALNTGAITMPAEITSQILNNKEYSYACWFCALGATGSTTERAMIFGNDGMSSLGGRQFSLFQYSTANNLHWSWQNYTGGTYSSAYGGVLADAFPTGQWVHLAVVYNNPSVKIYLNGEVKYTGSWVSNADSFAYNTKLIWNSQYHKLNDVRLYNHALSTKEVKEIAKGLILHYKLDNNGLGNPNLLDNTNQGSNYWLQSYGNGAGSLISDGIAAKYNITTQSTNWQVFAFKPSNNTTIMNNLSIAGKTYTLSFDIYSTSSFTTNPSYRDGNSQNNLITWPSFTTIANQWYHYEGSATTIGGTVSNQEIYINYKVPIGTYIFKNLKLEEGNKATPWSPYVNTNIIYDVSGYNHVATANAIAWSSPSPRYNAAAHLSLNSYITYSLPQNMYEVTYSFWVKASTYYNYGALNIPSGSPAGGTAPWFAINTEGCKVWAYFGSNPPYYTRGASGSLSTNEWHHCVYVWDNGIAQWYLDGEISGDATTYISKTYITNTAPSTIGDSYTGTSWSGTQFEGDISDFRVYATALSADDIKELYNTSATIDQYGNVYAREVVEI